MMRLRRTIGSLHNRLLGNDPERAAPQDTPAPCAASPAPLVVSPPPAPVPLAAPVVTRPVSYAVVNVIDLGRLQDRCVGRIDDCDDLEAVNAALDAARGELETVHPRIAARKTDVAQHLAEVALARVASDVCVPGDGSHIDAFLARVHAMGAEHVAFGLVANLRMLSLLNRASYSFDECASALDAIARDMGEAPKNDGDKAARQTLIENLQTWVFIAPAKLPPALPYLLAAFNRSLDALADKAGIKLDVELVMPTDDDNVGVAEALYESERAAATARDAQLAQALSRGFDFGGHGYASDSD